MSNFSLPKGHRFLFGMEKDGFQVDLKGGPPPDNENRQRRLAGPYGENLREMPPGPLFLYLTEKVWAESWVKGGEIPLNLASKYLSSIRLGTSTPDEVRQFRREGASSQQLQGFIRVAGEFRNLRVIGCSNNGVRLPDTRLDNYREDAFLLCFSTQASKVLMESLGKKVCVEIVDLPNLIDSVCQQIDPEVCYGNVKYTQGDERSHFIKSDQDAWMGEYRIVAHHISSTATLKIGAVARVVQW